MGREPAYEGARMTDFSTQMEKIFVHTGKNPEGAESHLMIINTSIWDALAWSRAEKHFTFLYVFQCSYDPVRVTGSRDAKLIQVSYSAQTLLVIKYLKAPEFT